MNNTDDLYRLLGNEVRWRNKSPFILTLNHLKTLPTEPQVTRTLVLLNSTPVVDSIQVPMDNGYEPMLRLNTSINNDVFYLVNSTVTITKPNILTFEVRRIDLQIPNIGYHQSYLQATYELVELDRPPNEQDNTYPSGLDLSATMEHLIVTPVLD